MPYWITKQRTTESGRYRDWWVVEFDDKGKVFTEHGPFTKEEADTMANVLRNTFVRGFRAGKANEKKLLSG